MDILEQSLYSNRVFMKVTSDYETCNKIQNMDDSDMW